MKRVEYIDVLKGIAILLVVVGHFWKQSIVSYVIWSFHMPLFILISGYFFKDRLSMKIKLKKMLRNYGVPYALVVTTLMIKELLVCVLQNRKMKLSICILNGCKSIIKSFISALFAFGNPTAIGDVIYKDIGAVWFLPALLFGEIILLCVYKFTHNRIKRVAVISLIVILCSLINIYSTMPFQILASGAFSAWLLLGAMIKEKQYKLQKYIDNNTFRMIGGLIWIIIIYIEIKFKTSFDVASLKYPLYGLGSLGAISGSYTFLNISKFITKYMKNVKKYFSCLGRNTIWILCAHSLDMSCMSWIYNRYCAYVNTFFVMLIRMTFCLGFAYIIKRLYKKLNEREKKHVSD